MRHIHRLILGLTVLGIGLLVLIFVFKNEILEFRREEAGLPRIEIAGTTGDSAFLLFFAQAKGYFNEEGLDVIIPTFESSATVAEELITGKYDLVVMPDFTFAYLLATQKKMPDIKIVASMATFDNNVVLVRENTNILVPRDLKGKKVGVTKSTASDFFLEQFLGRNGLAADDVEVIYLNPGALINAIIQKELDAVVTWEPNVYRIRQLFNFDINSWPAQNGTRPHFLMVSHGKWLDKNPDLAQKILRALIKAEETALLKNNEAQLFFMQRSGYSNQYAKLAWPKYQFSISLTPDLLITLKEYNEWLIKNRDGSRTIPDYSYFIYFEGLGEIKPEAFR